MKVDVWTDGSSMGQRGAGPGGWAFVAIIDEKELLERSGGARRTTNQRMEVISALMALRAFPEGTTFALHSDSAYLINCMRQKWYEQWQANGWRNSRKRPVANRDLWELLIEEAARHDIEWRKVKGHVRVPKTDSHRYNARADALAVAAKSEVQP